jgi:hypothetical protein
MFRQFMGTLPGYTHHKIHFSILAGWQLTRIAESVGESKSNPTFYPTIRHNIRA